MSEKLLDMLSQKKEWGKLKPVEIKLEKGQLGITQKLTKADGTYNIKALRERLKKKGLSVPKLFDSSQTIEGEKESKTESGVSKSIIREKGEDELDDELEDEPQKRSEEGIVGEEKKDSDKRPTRKKIDKSKIRRRKTEVEEIVLELPPETIQIEDRPIQDRLPNKDASVNIKAPRYYLNNREYFVNFINSMLKPYADTIAAQKEEDITCDTLTKSKSKGFSLMLHQQIIRDYLNVYTPYRGLLLFHGLGAGKTCASIGIAEGLKTTNQIIVMTPASLRANYISELKHCGDPLYKMNQWWEKIKVKNNLHLAKALSEIIHLPYKFILKQGWVWMVDVKKDSNYKKLPSEEQTSINKQIEFMIRKKYKFINYNGIRNQNLNELINDECENDIEYNGKEEDKNDYYDNLIETKKCKNPFDNKVIIIDEAHNFVSRIVNKLKSKKKTLSIRLYEYILSANNCRVIFLTGTPVINYPNEIAILFNMLRGYIKTFYIKLETAVKINQKKIMTIFKKAGLVDYIEYSPSNATLIITRNPFGFQTKLKKRDSSYIGVRNANAGLKNDNQFISSIKSILGENNIKISSNIKIKNHKALPDNIDIFRDIFIDSVTGRLKEENLFKRRIIGLTSYFRSASESLLPSYDATPKYNHIEKIEMSTYQIGVYEKARAAERKEEDRNKKKKAKGKNDIYQETTSTYRIFSRAFCNFVFPEENVKLGEKTFLLTRPMPKTDQTLEEAITTKKTKRDKEKGINKKSAADEDIVDGAGVNDKLDNSDGLYTREDIDDINKVTSEQIDSSYKSRIDFSLKLLEKNGGKYLSKSGLKQYGPKFLRVLNNITNPDNIGLHLIYSQFRTLEGVGILSLVLKQNGFAQFKISKSRPFKIDISPEDEGKPMFGLYTGTETVEEKEIIRNIFNGDWDKIPSSLRKELETRGENNNLGQIIKVLMITSSGSEGITLKNTRFVHLIEPYWHPVRTEQVIGRARRICSHKDLPITPINLRTVEVFTYLMTFTEKQINGDKTAEKKEDQQPLVSQALKNSKADKSKLDKTTLFTSDETLYEISNIKKTTNNSILKAIKESSIDCVIHSKSNKKEGIACYSFGSPSTNTFSFKPNYSTEEKDSVEKQNYKSVTWEAFPITVSGVKYAQKRTHPNPQTKIEKKLGELYDFDSYILAKSGKGKPILVGRIDWKDDRKQKIKYIPL